MACADVARRSAAVGRTPWRAGLHLDRAAGGSGDLGLLAAFAAPQVLSYLGRAKTDAARAQVQNIAGVLDLYRLEVGSYPAQQDGLEALLEEPADAPRWNGPYVKRRDVLMDPWGRMYVYRFPGDHGAYDLYSLGADNGEGGDGEDQDITSW